MKGSMIVIPYYDLLALPDVTCYIQAEQLKTMAVELTDGDSDVVFLMMREQKETKELTAEDFYPIATSGRIEHTDNEEWLLLTTTERVDVNSIQVEDGEISLETSPRPDMEDISEEELQERFRKMRDSFIQAVSGTQWSMGAGYAMRWRNINELISFSSGMLHITEEEKYAILAEDSLNLRTEQMEQAFYKSLEIFKIQQEAQKAQQESNEQLYREDAIKKQIEFLQKELDEMHPENVTDVRRFEQKIAESGMNETARAEAEKVLNRMKQEGKNSHEYGLLYDYLDFVTGLSWKKEETASIDLDEAEEILDEDHFGLKKVKERILQQIAVMNLKQKQSGSILLFVGAPGTGKTSIGQSIARALKRKYVRVSLGGIRDEAEIRGHRRTYVGAMPGRIMDGIRRSGVSNPVMVLDEVDKLTRDYSGDPSSALLEVLDPEQNNSFTDHYMNVPYDLSNVLFVCTANTMDTIPEPLLNRMEVIRFAGYTASEKFQIGKRHLLPRAMEQAGIQPQMLTLEDEALRRIVSDYTMEAGVRGLKKQLDTLCRSTAVAIVRGKAENITVDAEHLTDYLGRRPLRHDSVLEEKRPGIVTGLAWTQAGGEILFIETAFTPGSGRVVITGQLGDVMQESVQIALTLAKETFPDQKELFEKNDLHVHVPEGAVPKDGPSAGITLTTALASLVTGRAVEPTLAMTGEVSLRGFVLPIGGLPEKLMAALRAGVRTVLIPQENTEDLEDVPQEVKDGLEIIPVHTVEEVLIRTGAADSSQIKRSAGAGDEQIQEI